MGVTLSGHIDVPDARRAAVAAALPEHVRLTRAEPGCLAFEVTPDPEVPGHFRVAERFFNRAAFEARQARAAGTGWARVTEGIQRHCPIAEEG